MMRKPLRLHAAILTAVLLTGCASSPPPPPPPPQKPSALANAVVKTVLEQAKRDAEKIAFLEQLRARDEADRACLREEQRAEIRQRTEMVRARINKEMFERSATSMQRVNEKNFRERTAAQYALDRCEAALDKNSDKSAACVEERAERAKYSAPPPAVAFGANGMFESMARIREAAQEIRKEYPACGEVK
jgi:outer membrane murein-binding lipoprotein Lpp